LVLVLVLLLLLLLLLVRVLKPQRLCADPAAEDARDSDREERLEKELEADEDSDNDGGEDNAPQASRGRGERSGSRQVAAVAEEEDEVEEVEEAGAATGSSSGGGGQGALRRPPVLFQPDDPSMMTEAQKKEAGLHVERSIHVVGGKGKNEAKFPDGKATIKLKPGAKRQWAFVCMCTALCYSRSLIHPPSQHVYSVDCDADD
jgi:hypothetical protein